MKNKFVLIASHAKSVINFRRNLIDDLQNNSMDVHVLIPKLSSIDNDVTRKKIEEIGVTVHEVHLNRTGLNLISDFIAFIHIVITLWKIKPDYVISYTIKPVIYGTLAAKIAGIKHRFALITGLGSVFNEGKSKRSKSLLFIVKHMYKVSLLGAEKVFFQNPDDMRLFQKYKIVSALQSCVVNGSGVDLDYYKFSNPPGKISFLLLARLLNSKGVRIYFEAAQIVKSLYPNIEFSLAGHIDDLNNDSISRGELDSWIERKVINYYGQMSDVRTAIANCSIYVLPSFYREGVPRSILEAMSMGRAIITTNTPGCKETVIDGENGYLIDPKSVSKLVDAIMKFVNQPETVRKMGVKSREMAEEKYDVYKVNDFMLRKMKIKYKNVL
jgi:glycosyltransferase involved in cell wall biosynthesis